MKLLPFVFGLLTALTANAQTVPSVADSLFMVTYSLGETWDKSKGPGEQPYFKEHGARLGQLRKDGVIKLGARYADKGMIVIAAADITKAKEIINADVAVQNKLFVADVQKLNLFYDGCLERKK